eukprot:c22013_g1_i1 orf=1315-1929(-)
MAIEVLNPENEKLHAEPAKVRLDSQGALETDRWDVHVLVVDDNALDRKVVERLMKAAGYKVTTAESGLRALEILGVGDSTNPSRVNAYRINLIITDYCMPGMSGYELLKRVKETNLLKEIPVAILSSENVADRIESCLAEGAEDFILKPLQLADVKQLRRHISETRLHAVEQFGTPCIKRKFSLDTLQAQKSQSRPRLDGVTVP